jgi:hypothetical protein
VSENVQNPAQPIGFRACARLSTSAPGLDFAHSGLLTDLLGSPPRVRPGCPRAFPHLPRSR